MKKILKLHFGIGAVAALLFLSIAVYVAVTMRAMMVEEAHKTVEGVVKTAVANIDNLVTGVESAVNNSAWIVRDRISDPDFAVRMSHELVRANPLVVGSTVAFAPNYHPDRGWACASGRLYAPYSSRDAHGNVVDASLRYDYTVDTAQGEWYVEPMRTGKPRWCEPYFDEGGGNIMMSTYSVPVQDGSGRIVAILTADVSLADLTAHVSKVRPYADSFATLRTAKGTTLVAPPKGRAFGSDKSESGHVVVISGTAHNGWKVELTTPLLDILRSAQRVVMYIGIFSLLGLGLILTVSWVFSNRLQRQAADHQRVESELAIANAIQTSMVSVSLPDWAAGRMRPAKEVGGDRYDFAERDGTAWFGIGDASGKGVPAALYTSLVGAAFRMGVEANLDPAALVGAVNRIVAENNHTGMFVTAFVGRLERATGRLEFCNAGHNPPIVIEPDGTARPLDVARNLVMGAVEDYGFKAQSADLAPGSKLVMYTDGVTEAMNAANEQYGMERLLAFASAHANDAPNAMADALMKSVAAFAGNAPQSDDITVLVVSC